MYNFEKALSEVFPIIEKFAPTIAGAIGGVPGVVAEEAVAKLLKAFNIEPNPGVAANLDSAVSSILNNSSSHGILQQLEKEHVSSIDVSAKINFDSEQLNNS